MCPTSNRLTKAVEDMADYPLIEYLDQGIKVTINTDDMGIERTTMAKEFKYIEKKRGARIHLQFLERVINIAIVIVVIIIPLAGDKIGTSILGSAAVITAVVGACHKAKHDTCQ